MSKRRKTKGRREGGRFAQFPAHVFQSSEYAELSAQAVKLLVDIFMQYNGKNNGDFCTAWSVMSKCGWKSRDTLCKALKELQRAGFILKTRQGGKGSPSLYAVTWRGINDCKGKLDIPPQTAPPNTWHKPSGNVTPLTAKNNSLTRLPCQPNTATVSIEGSQDVH